MFDYKLAWRGPQRPGGAVVRRFIGWAIGLAMSACPANVAYAQLSEMPARPKIIVASTLTAAPSALFDLNIRIESQDLVPMGAYLEIRGLPQFATLSAGQALSRRSWALPLELLSNLTMQVPAQATGRWELDLRLVTRSSVGIAFASTALIIEPAPVVAGDDKKPDVSRTQQSQGPTTSLPQAPKAVEQERSENRVARTHNPAAGAGAGTKAGKEFVEMKSAEQKNNTDQRGSSGDQQMAAVAEGRRQDEPKALREQRDETVSPTITQEQARPEPENRRQSGIETVKPHQVKEAQPWRDTEPKDGNKPAAQTSLSGRTADAQSNTSEPQETSTQAADTLRPEQASDTQPKPVTAGTTETAPEEPLTESAAGARVDQQTRQSKEESRERVASNIDPATSLAALDNTRPTTTGLEAQAAAAKLEQAGRLLSRGDLYITQGNIVVARQYYLRAADMGVANAAIKLAETYDPHEIARLRVIGLFANAAEAKHWYQRASLLGAPEAEARLRRLGRADVR